MMRLVTVAFVACAALAVPLAAQAPPASGAQIPLREGLTTVRAYRNTAGDFEAITTVTHVDATSVTIAMSTDEQADPCRDRAAESGRPRSSGLRMILREDLERAHALWQEFAGCPSAPEVHAGSTAIGVSSDVLHELNSTGQTTLSATTTVAGMVPGTLTRIERGVVPLTVIVNDEAIALKAVHARWQSNVGAREYWILDDVANPLVLRGTYNGSPFLEVVKVSYPVDGTTPVARIQRALEREGHTTVYGIHFDVASERIRNESEPVLASIAKVLQQNRSWTVAVEGHTDSIGGDQYNVELSRRRATAVMQALISRYGVDGKRLQATGLGASQPKDTNETVQGRARNRRVELVLGPSSSRTK